MKYIHTSHRDASLSTMNFKSDPVAVLAEVDDVQGLRRAVDVSCWLPWRPSLVRSADLSAL